MIDYQKVRLLIREKYGNESKFAEANKISKSKVSLILNEKMGMDMDFADLLVMSLDMTAEQIQTLFFKR